MTKIFISYRRIDTASVTEQICRAIRRKYGRDSVFVDVDTIPPGTDFREAVRSYINRSDVMLAIIGRRWLEASDYRGTHSIMDPTDYVRIEIGAAFAREIPLLPVLVDGAPMPDPGQLPDELRRLPYVQAIDVSSGTGFRSCSKRLMGAVDDSLRLPPPPPLTVQAGKQVDATSGRRQTPRSGRSLTDLLRFADQYTVITGSRRSRPARLPCDILLSVDWADFVLLDQLPARGRRCIARDVEFTTDQRQGAVSRDVFQHLLVAVGAPDVNFAALVLNETALFRFAMDPKAYGDVFDLFDRMQQGGYRDRVQFLLRHEDELRDMVERLCPGSMLDPCADGFEIGRQGLMRFAHGMVTLTGHPFVPGGMAVFAGGISGPCTAGAVALLAGRPIFDPCGNRFAGIESRPLGGIFRRKDPSREPPHDVLHVEDDLEWVTPPYDRSELTRRLHDMHRSARRPEGITREDIDRMLKLVKRFEKAVARPSTTRQPKFRLIIPIGGRGSRMKTFLRGGLTKAELPIALGDTGTKKLAKKKLREETVLGMIIRALKATRMVDDVLLLTRNSVLPAHKSLARSLLKRYGIPIAVESDGSDPFAGALSKRLASYSQHVTPTVLMMGDTLIHPDDLRRLLQWAAREQPLLAVAYADVPAEDVSRYGMVDLYQKDRVRQILEKPGKCPTRAAYQGIQVLFSYVRWERFLAESRASGPVGVISCAIEHGIPVRAFHLEKPVYDCGSPAGYARAREAGAHGHLW